MRVFLVLALLLIIAVEIVGIPDLSSTEAEYILRDTAHLEANRSYEITIDTRSRLNLTVVSDRIIRSKIHTSSGIPLKFKSRLIKVRDKIDFIKIENGDYDNNITIEINRIRKQDLDLETVVGFLVAVIIITERKSKYSAFALTLLLLWKIYTMRTTDDITDRVFKKYVF